MLVRAASARRGPPTTAVARARRRWIRLIGGCRPGRSAECEDIDLFVGLTVTASDESAGAAERRRRRREERQAILRKMEEDLAAPPPFRVTLAQARVKWPEWETAYNEQRVQGRRVAEEKFGVAGAGVLADLLLPEPPVPTDVVAYALDLECGHEDFWLVKRGDDGKPAPKRVQCPIFWSCHLNDGREAVRYIEPGEPEPMFAGFDFTRWSVELACGHPGFVWRADDGESRVGDYLLCQECERDEPDADVEIVALGEPLPDLMIQDWTVELNCGHVGTDHGVPIECQDDPAAYRAQNPTRRGLRCIDRACDEREVRGTRRLGVLGKIRTPKPAPPPLDPVAQAAKDLQRRLTKEQRQALIQQLQNDEQ
jgi:hypothetical protein